MKKNTPSALLKTNHEKRTTKNGSILLTAVIIGVVVLTAGLSFMNIFAKELKFSSDFVFSEMAYYAAESGVEEALIKLKNEPVEHLIPDNTVSDHGVISFEQSTIIELKINNLKNKFEFDLPPKENMKFRLKKDTNESESQSLDSVEDWKLIVTDDAEESLTEAWSWKIACQKSGETVSIQGQGGSGSNGIYNSFKNETGKEVEGNGNIITGTRSVENFFTDFTNESDKQTCFFSVTNLKEDKRLSFYFENPNGMSPHKTSITSIGKNNLREKIIQFDYKQKNLGGLFDFVLFHSDK